MKHLNLQHLMYFREIAVQESVTKAALRLGIAQAALSIQLKQFEDQLGQKLFLREKKKLILTTFGFEILQFANSIYQQSERLKDFVAHQEVHKQMRIGVMDNIPKSFVTSIASRLQSKTKASITLIEGDEATLVRELVYGRVEFIITEHAIDVFDNKPLDSVQLQSETLACFGTKAFQKLKRGFPQSLNNQRVILPTEHARLRRDLTHFFDLNDIHPYVVFEIQDTMVQKILAGKGEGVIFMPASAVGRSTYGLQVLGYIPTITYTYYCITLKGKELSIDPVRLV